MSRWLPKALARIHALAAAGAIRFTNKSRVEGALLGLSREDVREVLAALTPGDFARRTASRVRPEWLYVFMPSAGGELFYVKLALRDACVVISFHEDEGARDDEDAI